jgi:allantoin racemase
MKKIVLIEPAPQFAQYKKYATYYANMHEDTLDRIKGSDTKIIHKSCPPGFWKAPHTVIDYFMDGLAVPTICKGAIEAEEEGADALIIVCTDDPGLRFVRQLVDIPVIGEYECTLHLACMMGYKFGVISWPTRPFMARAEHTIRAYGLESNAIPNPIEPVLTPTSTAERDLVTTGYKDPKGFAQKYMVPAAQKLIQRGAEVIVMDSTGLSLIAENAGLSKIEDVGVPAKVNNPVVPVLNVVSVSLKQAEMMIDLRRTLNIPSVSRIGMYQKVAEQTKPEDLAMIRDYFEKDWKFLPMPKSNKPSVVSNRR